MNNKYRQWFVVLVALVFISMVNRAGAQKVTNFAKQLAELMPGIAHEDIEQRQASQEAWQKTCLEAGSSDREADRAAICIAMTKQLGDDVQAHARVFLLRQLERMGAGESVDAVAKLIGAEDPQISDAAIRALCANPDRAVGDVLCAALKANEERQVGLALIKALGYRGDPQCVELLTEFCNSISPRHRDAALAALARIKTTDAEKAIRQLIEAEIRHLRLEPFAEAYIVVANRLLDRGESKEAAEMYIKLAGEDFEKEPIRIAIAQGRLKTCSAVGESAGELVVQYLNGDDRKIQQVAAAHVRQLDAAWIKRLADRISQYPETAQLALLQSLGSYGNRAALPGVLKVVESDSADVRIAALRALAGLADASTVPILVGKLQKGGDEGEAAALSLERVFAPGVDRRIVQLVKTSKDAEQRTRFLHILNRRRATSTMDAIIDEASHDDPSVRKLAVAIFARLGGNSDIPKMIAAWKATPDRGERDEIEKAIVAVCRRIPDPERQGDPVLAVYHRADAESQTELLPLLGRLGGDQVLQLVRDEMKSDLSDKRLAANVQALANWPNAKVTNDLLRVSTHQDPSLRIRSVRALARVVVLRDDRSDEQRLDLLKQTMQKAERDEERDLILDRAKAIRKIETLRFVVPYLQNDNLRNRACQTIVELAHHRGLREPNQAEFDQALQQVIKLSDDQELAKRATGYMKK